ncbi:MAG: SDR family NAD(P)-dependent oxidoreductase [Thermoplasmata archaeon]
MSEGSSRDRPPKWVVISGATGGLGFEIAEGLVRAGYSLALIGRSDERLARARAALAPHLRRGELRLFRADLSELRATDRVAASIGESLDRIDGLVNNAGGIFAPFQRTSEGIERTWALNVLSPFLLTERLLPRLAASGAGRVVNISSAAHGAGRLRWDDLQRQGGYGAWGVYAQSKLALLMLTYEWARRKRELPVTFNAAHPGFVRTSFGLSLAGPLRPLVRLAMIGAVSPRVGARTPLDLVTTDGLGSGKYFAHGHPRRSSVRSYRVDEARRLYEECARQVAAVLFARPPGPATTAA